MANIFELIAKPLGIGKGVTPTIPTPLPPYKAPAGLFDAPEISTKLPEPKYTVRRQTIEDVQALPKQAKEFLLPSRGFSDEEIAAAKPTAKESALAVPRAAAEIVSGFGSLLGGSKILQAIADTKIGDKLADVGEKIQDFGTIKTPGEAKAARFVDAGTLFLGELRIGNGAASKIARSKNADVISEILQGEVKNLSKAEADKIAPLLTKVDKSEDVQRVLNEVNYAKNKAPQVAEEVVPKASLPKGPAKAPEAPVLTTEDPMAIAIAQDVQKGAITREEGVARMKELLGGVETSATIPVATKAPTAIPAASRVGTEQTTYLTTDQKGGPTATGVVERTPVESLKSTNEVIPSRVEKYAADLTSPEQLPPIVIDNANNIIDGNHRVAAAQKAGLGEVDAIRVSRKEADRLNKEIDALAYRKGENFIGNMTREDAETFIRQVMGETPLDIVFDPKLIERESALGLFKSGRDIRGINVNPMVRLYEEAGKVHNTTAYHEAFHGYFRSFLSDAERREILARVRRDPALVGHRLKSNYASEERAEEWLADDFAEYVKAKLGGNPAPASVFARAWEKLLNVIREFVRKKNDFIKLYEDALSGEKPRNSSIPAGKGTAERAGPILPESPRESIPQREAVKLDSEAASPVAYNKTTEKAIAQAAEQTGDSPKMVTRVLNDLKEIKTNVLEYVQDRSERVRQMVKDPKAKVTEESNPFLAMTLYDGRVGAKIEAGQEAARTLVSDMAAVAKDAGLKTPDIRKEVNDYLVARHAPERNAQLGEKAAGLTDSEAAARIKELEATPRGKKIVELADKAQELHNQTLEMLHDSQVITDELYNTLREKYPNHVPLQRIFDAEEGSAPVLGAKGYDVRSTGIKRAKGSEREVEDVLLNIITGYQEAVLRSEKNLVDLSTLRFAEENKNLVGDLLEISHPRAVGKDFAGKPILEKTTDPQVLQMFDKGKRTWIKIKDPKLAIALRGVGKEKLGLLLNAIAQFTRLYSGLATRFNPEFALPNKIRDLQETMIYLAAESDMGAKGATRMTVKDPGSLKDVLSALRGENTPGAELYRQMKADGGTTGGFGLSTKTQVDIDLKKLEKLAESKTKRIANNLVEYIDKWNTIFEDSTRLSVYKQALENGLSRKRAAALAKEASINFNRMGTGGPVINALYMFSNASIQGSTKMLRALKNQKVLGAVVLAVGSAVAAASEWNDNLDPDWREKTPKWDRLNGLTVVLPSTDGDYHYITVPVSWGVKPIKVMADYAYDAATGRGFDAKNAMGDTLGALANAYNPVGGTDFLSAITPTFLDVPFEIGRNQSWSGSKIRPDFDKNAPKDIQYFSSLKDTTTGRAAISISEILHGKLDIAVSPADMKYAYDQYVGGAGRAVSKTVNLITGAVQGEPPPLDEYPLVSRFYRSRAPDEISTDTGGKNQEIKDVLEGQSRDRFKTKMSAEDFVDSLKGMKPGEIGQKLVDIKKEDPELFAKIKDVVTEKAKGLTSTDKLIQQLGVENGERAAYILKEVGKLKTPAEKTAYLRDLQKKKLLTNDVVKQMTKLAKPTP